LKLKLEYSEKYCDELKVRERELRNEIAKLRLENQSSLRIEREKIEQQYRIKLSALEESRAKAVNDAQQLELQLKVLSYQQNHDKQNALLEQRLTFTMQADKAASEAEHREAELRTAMTSAQNKHESEARTLKDQISAERIEMTRKVFPRPSSKSNPAALFSCTIVHLHQRNT
jgi:leucyl aminopeptidase